MEKCGKLTDKNQSIYNRTGSYRNLKDEQEMIRLKNQRLEKLAQEIGQEAQERRLTPEIWQSLLSGGA